MCINTEFKISNNKEKNSEAQRTMCLVTLTCNSIEGNEIVKFIFIYSSRRRQLESN